MRRNWNAGFIFPTTIDTGFHLHLIGSCSRREGCGAPKGLSRFSVGVDSWSAIKIKEMKQNGLWEFFVDTGGTFTDCLARSPSSLWFREKVLSRGSFSAKVKEVLGAYRLSICTANDWPCGFIEGMAVRFANFPKLETKILNWDGKESLTLSDKLPVLWKEGPLLSEAGGKPILAMRLILARQGVKLEEIRVQMRLATTRCTNALLERKGEVPVLFLTAGFPDLLEIGDQDD